MLQRGEIRQQWRHHILLCSQLEVRTCVSAHNSCTLYPPQRNPRLYNFQFLTAIKATDFPIASCSIHLLCSAHPGGVVLHRAITYLVQHTAQCGSLCLYMSNACSELSLEHLSACTQKPYFQPAKPAVLGEFSAKQGSLGTGTCTGTYMAHKLPPRSTGHLRLLTVTANVTMAV